MAHLQVLTAMGFDESISIFHSDDSGSHHLQPVQKPALEDEIAGLNSTPHRIQIFLPSRADWVSIMQSPEESSDRARISI